MKNDDVLREYYKRNPETNRLAAGGGRLEFLRTKEIIARFLPPAPCRVLEVGGGTGHYSYWLAELGHKVTLVDLAEEHIALVREKNTAAVRKLEGIGQGDARKLGFKDESFDIVLNLGPIYHLQERPDRLCALREARRVLKPGGTAITAYISRFASLIDGYRYGFIRDPAFRDLVACDLATGRHESAGDRYFTRAYLHHPEEIVPELCKAGFASNTLLAVECFFRNLKDLDTYLENPEDESRLLEYARLIESDRSIIGASAHILAVSIK